MHLLDESNEAERQLGLGREELSIQLLDFLLLSNSLDSDDQALGQFVSTRSLELCEEGEKLVGGILAILCDPLELLAVLGINSWA